MPRPSTIMSSLPVVLPVFLAADQAGVARLLERAATAARHHTGGSGFAPDGTAVDGPIADLLVNSVRRALSNPECSLVGDEGAFSLRPGSFADWSYDEYAVLERYRTQPQPQPQPHDRAH